DVAAWAVHPGGPRILRTVEEALQLPPEALQASRQVPAGVPAGVGRLRQLLVRDRAAGAGEAAARRWSTSWAARARARFRSRIDPVRGLAALRRRVRRLSRELPALPRVPPPGWRKS